MLDNACMTVKRLFPVALAAFLLITIAPSALTEPALAEMENLPAGYSRYFNNTLEEGDTWGFVVTADTDINVRVMDGANFDLYSHNQSHYVITELSAFNVTQHAFKMEGYTGDYYIVVSNTGADTTIDYQHYVTRWVPDEKPDPYEQDTNATTTSQEKFEFTGTHAIIIVACIFAAATILSFYYQGKKPAEKIDDKNKKKGKKGKTRKK